MGENFGGKVKTSPSIPANYISILELKERWINEKERKQKKEEKERRREEQVEEEKRIDEEDLIKVDEEKRLNRTYRKRNGRKKKSMNGGGARFVEKEKPEVTVAIGRARGKVASERVAEKNKAVVCCGFVSIAPSESIVAENVTPVKDEIRVYRKKGEKAAKGDKCVVTDDSTTIAEKFEDLSIKRGESKNLKAQTKPSYRNLVRMPIRAASKMVWVKKEHNERAADGIGSGEKPLAA